MENDTPFMILWEYQVKSGCESEFEEIYGAEGDWVRFFRLAAGYLGTELHRDVHNPTRYVTIDSWSYQAAYETFCEQHLSEYHALDAQCEALTERETHLGSFLCLGRPKLY